MTTALIGMGATFLTVLFGYLAARLTRKSQSEQTIDARWQAMLDGQKAHFETLLKEQREHFLSLLDPLYKSIDGLEEDLSRVTKDLHTERAQFKIAIRFIRELLDWITHHAPGVDPPVIPKTLKDEM